MENKETLGKRIAMLRKEKGLTQEQLAEKVGVSAQAVSKWENDVSCPDITLLPLLADILGVTVDELLGVKPIEPHVIILDKDETPKEEAKKNRSFSWEWNKHKKSARWGTISFCIGAILVCLFFLLHSFGMFPYSPFAFDGDLVLKGWNYVWPLLVFTLGLSSVIEHPAFGGVMMAFGGYEFVRRVLLGYQIATLPAIPWYVILLAMAIVVLLLVLIGKKHLICKVKKDDENTDHTPVLDVTQDDNYLDADMSFGSGVITYDGDTLRGGSIDMNFGDYKVDLRRVRTFTDNCLLEIDQNFGSLTIFMPQHVRLVKSSDTSFGSFATYGEPSPDATQSIIIRADVNFGTLQVKYE
ncbi:MAG: helix-turn-helix transcriptional regulator [Clostridia bacterium]|nr:helix-turn-helix transcriptional regulator [Clostridia bacterium]